MRFSPVGVEGNVVLGITGRRPGGVADAAVDVADAAVAHADEDAAAVERLGPGRVAAGHPVGSHLELETARVAGAGGMLVRGVGAEGRSPDAVGVGPEAAVHVI